MLMWRGHAFYDCTAEFRLSWLQAKLAEEAMDAPRAPPGDAMDAERPAGSGACAHGPSLALRGAADGEAYRLAALRAHAADEAGLAEAHGGCEPFVRDGVYLLHRDGHYQAAGAPCPLALLWKDAACSRYLLDTDVDGRPLDQQVKRVRAQSEPESEREEAEKKLAWGNLWDARGMRVGCVWDARGMRVGCPWDARGMRVGCPWDACGMRVGCPWEARGMPALACRDTTGRVRGALIKRHDFQGGDPNRCGRQVRLSWVSKACGGERHALLDPRRIQLRRTL
eukprot:363662-Chlamydomonas_euryale.AAC.27